MRGNRKLWLGAIVIGAAVVAACVPDPPPVDPAPTSTTTSTTSTSTSTSTTSTTTTTTVAPDPDPMIPDALRGEITMPDELRKAVEPIAFLRPPPLTGRQVDLAVDGSRTTSARIGVDGGVLEVATAAGDQLTLTIPPAALVANTTITATPITGISDVTVGQVHGLDLRPEGLTLLEPAMLEVVPAGGVTNVPAVGAQSDGLGGGFSPQWLMPDPEGLTLPVQRFSGHMVIANPGTGASAPFTAQEYASSSNGSLSDLVTRERTNQLAGQESDPEFREKAESLVNAEFQNVIVPILERGVTDCAFWEYRGGETIAHMKSRLLLGIESADEEQLVVDATIAATQNCWNEATVGRCLAMNPDQWKVLMALNRHMLLRGFDTDDGTTPDFLDDSQIPLCGSVNGWIDYEDHFEQDTEFQTQDYRASARAWVSAETAPVWVGGKLAGLTVLNGQDRGSIIDADLTTEFHQWTTEGCSQDYSISKSVLAQDFAPEVPGNRLPRFSLTFQVSGPDDGSGSGWVDYSRRWPQAATGTDSCYGEDVALDIWVNTNSAQVTATWDDEQNAVELHREVVIPHSTSTSSERMGGTLIVGGKADILGYGSTG